MNGVLSCVFLFSLSRAPSFTIDQVHSDLSKLVLELDCTMFPLAVLELLVDQQASAIHYSFFCYRIIVKNTQLLSIDGMSESDLPVTYL